MLVKRLLRFYRSAEKLNGHLDGLIEYLAVQSGADAFLRGERFAERLIYLIEEKSKLADFWARLNGVMEGLTDADRLTLSRYADMRSRPESEADGREIHRAVVKFTRRAHFILMGRDEGLKLVKKYYGLMFPGIDCASVSGRQSKRKTPHGETDK